MYNGYLIQALNQAFKDFNRIYWELIFYPFGSHERAKQAYRDFACMYMMGGEL